MNAVRTWKRAAVIVLMSAGAAGWYACTEHSADPLTGPSGLPMAPDLRQALLAQKEHADKLLDIPGVVGTAVGVLQDGRASVQVLLERAGVAGVPQVLDGVPVTQQVTGRLMAFSDPTKRQRPAPLGFSVGHPAITAGTIGARVRDAAGHVYILSNNHVLANSNNATIGQPEYQPGPYDGGTAADQIATLSDFQAIIYGTTTSNIMDAAIALSSTNLLDNATPADDAYGAPNAKIYGDANNDGAFDDRSALLGLHVQKYGRTTHLTHGQITGVNATITVCYEVSGLTCTLSARFVDQLIITPGTFSGGGDSGSLIVTDDENKNPVALLFAGSSTLTIGNRIDLVLNRFGVTIDGTEPPPPGPLTDLAIISVSATPPVVVNSPSNVTVTVRNFGNQDVSSFDVTLQDTTEHVNVGSQTVSGLLAGATTTLTFPWTPGTTGTHGLIATHGVSDDRPANDQGSATVEVSPPLTDVAVTTISAPGSVITERTINVTVTVANVGNQPVGSSFDVTLRDATDNVILGTQTVPGLTWSTSGTLTFPWNTTGATLGAHTLVATQGFTDDNAANNQRSVILTVSPKPADIAMTAFTGPSPVTQGTTANYTVTVQNVGEQNITTGFDVVVTDATAGVTVGTQTVASLVIGASATLTFPWNTTGVATGGHTLIARQMLADANGTNDSRAVGIQVNPAVTQVTDVAVTALNAPAAVTQGTTVSVGVTVGNTGNQPVGTSFVVTLRDATDNVTIGTQTVASLGLGANATLTFSWSTTSATLGSHSLTASHALADDNATNNQRSATVSVNPQLTDIAVTNLTRPTSVLQGNSANIGVTVQNVGGQTIGGSFNVVLVDSTTGVTIGTRAVAGLNVGASTIVTFSWNTTGVALGTHTLVATQQLADANPANDQRSATILVNPKPLDVAMTSLTGPASIPQGSTANIGVTVQNVGGQNVTSGFTVVLTDATVNVTIGTQTVSSLGIGASTTLTFPWNTTGFTIRGHTLIARQTLPDADPTNDSRAIGISVVTPPVHVGDLDAVTVNNGSSWSSTVEITVHDADHNPVSGALVHGTWSPAGTNTVDCTTGDTGTCTVSYPVIATSSNLAVFIVSSVTRAGYAYQNTANHDPDGSSGGTMIIMVRP